MDEEQEELDPRVQVELERLNTSTDEINRFESQLEEANNVFRSILSESTARLKSLSKKLGGCIEKARPYYEAVEEARISQMDCQRAAVQYQRANALHAAAKQTIALAEERFVKCKDEHWQFDSAWQEMLNHATIKVMEAEAQKAASEREHMKRASAYSQMQLRVQQLQRGLKSAIYKSRIYFDQKAQVQAQLNNQKEHVEQLQRSITANKTIYTQTLRSLEQISEEIHEARRCRLPREPGVGAEINMPTSDISNLQRYNSAINLHSALEEKTAQEEKYWESLREKLEELKTSDQEPLEVGAEEISRDYLDYKQRSLTVNSVVEDLERVVSGESETEDKSEPEDKSDCEEILDLSISLENVNLFTREHGVGSENDNIVSTDEENANKYDIYEVRKDSDNVQKVDIGNEKDSECGSKALSKVIMSKESEECDASSLDFGRDDLSCHRDVIGNHQQNSSMHTTPLGVTFTREIPDLYPTQCEYEESKANLNSNNNVNRVVITNKVISEPDNCHPDVSLNEYKLTCDTIEKDKDQSASEGCIEDSDPHIDSSSQFSNEIQDILNDNDKQNVYKPCVLSEQCTIDTYSNEYVSNSKHQSSFLVNSGNESNNEVSVCYNNGNTNNYKDIDNGNESKSPNLSEMSPVIISKPKTGV